MRIIASYILLGLVLVAVVCAEMRRQERDGRI